MYECDPTAGWRLVEKQTLPQKEAAVPEKTKSVWESFAEMMRKQRLTLAEQEERQRFQMWHHRGLLVELKYLPNNKTCCELRGRSGGGG